MRLIASRFRALVVAARLVALAILPLALAGAPEVAHAAFLMFGVHGASAPVVSSASFSLNTPLTTGQTVGTMSATNAPTSWSLTGCSPTCTTYFAISNSGVITITSAGAAALTTTTYTLTVQATNGVGSGNNTATVAISAVSYVGLMDQYPSEGVYWGFHSYKLSAAYAGNWATVQRASDSTSLAIGFVSGLADAASLATFCANTSCYATTLNDSTGGGRDATCTNVRAFVDAYGRAAVAPQHGASCSVPYNAALAQAKVEMFAVAGPMFQDNRPYQAGLPTYVTTGNVTNGSNTIASLGSAVGISAANNLYNQPAIPGVQDAAGCLPGSGSNAGSESFTAVSTSVTLSPSPGTASPSCTQAGDTLTFTNAVLGGVWISQGPNAAFSSAYWGFGIGVVSVNDPYAGSSVAVRNAGVASTVLTGNGSAAGQALRQAMAVWDVDTFSGTVYYDGVQFNAGASTANVTYGTNVGLTLFAAPDGSDGLQNGVFEGLILVNQTAANRVSVASWLMSQAGLTATPTTYTDGNGFTYRPELLAPYPPYANAYGENSVTDANAITWNPQTGGYFGSSGPSAARATNINNGATQWRFVDQSGDSDIGITQAERTEVASSNARITPGQSASFFFQARFDAYTAQNGDWCYRNQVHYDNAGGNNAPDIFALNCKSGNLQVVYQKGTSTTSCGSAIAISVGTTYAFQVELTWSSGGTTDSISVYEGVNGGALTLLCSASGALFATGDTGAYMKLGIYRGYPYSNAGTLISEDINAKWSNTANAFASLRTTQPALPTHP